MATLETLTKDKAFMQKVLAMTPEDASKEFAAQGVEISVGELNAAADYMNKVNSGEISESDLELVSGGVKPTAGNQIAYWGVVAALCVGVACCW